MRVRVRVRAVKNSGLGPLRLAGAQAQAPQDPAGGRPKAPLALSGPIPRAGPIEPGMRTSGPAVFNARPAGRLLISRPSGPVLVLNHDSDSPHHSRCHGGCF